MAALDDILTSQSHDEESKPWDAFVRQNPGIAPLVSGYLAGGSRPTDMQLGGNQYALARVYEEDARRKLADPSVPPPPPSGLPFAEPVLENPLKPAIPVSQRSFACETDRDYLIDLGWEPRQSLVLTGRPRRVIIRDYYNRVTDPFSAGPYGRGGIGLQLLAEHVALTGYYTEARPTLADCFRYACAPTTKITLQKVLMETPSDSQEPAEHCDNFQTQGPCGRVEIGLATMFIPAVREPNHGGKGLQLDVWTPMGWPVTAGPFTVDLRKVDFETQGNAATGARSIIAIGKDDNTQIGITLAEVYASEGANAGPSSKWENLLVNYPSALGKAITGTAPNRRMTFTNAAQGWAGDFRERPPGTHFVTKTLLGI